MEKYEIVKLIREEIARDKVIEFRKKTLAELKGRLYVHEHAMDYRGRNPSSPCVFDDLLPNSVVISTKERIENLEKEIKFLEEST